MAEVDTQEEEEGEGAGPSCSGGPEARAEEDEEEEEEVEATETAPWRRLKVEHASSRPLLPPRRTIRGSVAGTAAFRSKALNPGARHRDLDPSRCGGRSSAGMRARRDEIDEASTSNGCVVAVFAVDVGDVARRAAARRSSLAAVI